MINELASYTEDTLVFLRIANKINILNTLIRLLSFYIFQFFLYKLFYLLLLAGVSRFVLFSN